MKYLFLSFFSFFYNIQVGLTQSTKNSTNYIDLDLFTGYFKIDQNNHLNKKDVSYFISKDHVDSTYVKVVKKSLQNKKQYTENIKTFYFDERFKQFVTEKKRVKFLEYVDSGIIKQNKIFITKNGYYYGRDLYKKENTIFEVIDSFTVKVTQISYRRGIDSINSENSLLANFAKWENDPGKSKRIVFYYSSSNGFWELTSCEGVEQKECALFKKNATFNNNPASLFWLICLF